jgi:hypothetical protein
VGQADALFADCNNAMLDAMALQGEVTRAHTSFLRDAGVKVL